MSRQAQGFVLLLLGGAVLRAGLTDVYLRYVKAGLRPLLLVAGVVLLAAAAATFWYELRRDKHEPDEHDNGDGQAHQEPAHHEPRVAWLLVLPVFVLILVAPPALGSYAANRAGTALQPGLIIASPPAGDPAPMSLLNYATLAVYDHGRSDYRLHHRRRPRRVLPHPHDPHLLRRRRPTHQSRPVRPGARHLATRRVARDHRHLHQHADHGRHQRRTHPVHPRQPGQTRPGPG
jgi:hypothetical protein